MMLRTLTVCTTRKTSLATKSQKLYFTTEITQNVGFLRTSQKIGTCLNSATPLSNNFLYKIAYQRTIVLCLTTLNKSIN
jgi:hypothetical protein